MNDLNNNNFVDLTRDNFHNAEKATSMVYHSKYNNVLLGTSNKRDIDTSNTSLAISSYFEAVGRAKEAAPTQFSSKPNANPTPNGNSKPKYKPYVPKYNANRKQLIPDSFYEPKKSKPPTRGLAGNKSIKGWVDRSDSYKNGNPDRAISPTYDSYEAYRNSDEYHGKRKADSRSNIYQMYDNNYNTGSSYNSFSMDEESGGGFSYSGGTNLYDDVPEIDIDDFDCGDGDQDQGPRVYKRIKTAASVKREQEKEREKLSKPSVDFFNDILHKDSGASAKTVSGAVAVDKVDATSDLNAATLVNHCRQLLDKYNMLHKKRETLPEALDSLMNVVSDKFIQHILSTISLKQLYYQKSATPSAISSVRLPVRFLDESHYVSSFKPFVTREIYAAVATQLERLCSKPSGGKDRSRYGRGDELRECAPDSGNIISLMDKDLSDRSGSSSLSDSMAPLGVIYANVSNTTSNSTASSSDTLGVEADIRLINVYLNIVIPSDSGVCSYYGGGGSQTKTKTIYSCISKLSETLEYINNEDLVILLMNDPVRKNTDQGCCRSLFENLILDGEQQDLASVDVSGNHSELSAATSCCAKYRLGIVSSCQMVDKNKGVTNASVSGGSSRWNCQLNILIAGDENKTGREYIGESWRIIPFLSLSTFFREYVALHGISSSQVAMPLSPYILKTTPVVSVEYLNEVSELLRDSIDSVITHCNKNISCYASSVSASDGNANKQKEVQVVKRVFEIQSNILEYLELLQHVQISSSVLKNCSSLGKILRVLSNNGNLLGDTFKASKSNKFYDNEGASKYLDSGLNKSIQSVTANLVTKWKKQIQREHSLTDDRAAGSGELSVSGSPEDISAPHGVSKELWGVLRSEYNTSQLYAIAYVCERNCSRYVTDSIENSEGNAPQTITEPSSPALSNKRIYNKLSISLIQGPPGTGKTSTIIGLVSSLLCIRGRLQPIVHVDSTIDTTHGEGGKVPLFSPPLLICAPSNAAVDEILKRLLHSESISNDRTTGVGGVYNHLGIKSKARIVRLGRSKQGMHSILSLEEQIASSASGVVSDSPTKLAGSVSVETLTDELLKSDKNSPYQAYAKLLREMEQIRKALDISRGGSNAGIDSLNGASTAENRATYRQMRVSKSFLEQEVEVARICYKRRILLEADIIVSTLSSAGNNVLSDLIKGVDMPLNMASKYGVPDVPASALVFDTVIVDEAAQCTEPSSLIPLHFGCHNLIMIGDARQLPATVLQECGAGATDNYGRSLFERLEKSGHEVIMLNTQYRMHPDIRLFPSAQFYNNQLVDGPSIVSELSNKPLLNKSGGVVSCLQELLDLPPCCVLDTNSVMGDLTLAHELSIASHAVEIKAGTSYINPGEIMVILKLLYAMDAALESTPVIGTYSIGILSPYKAQMNAIQQVLKRAARCSSNIPVTMTIHGDGPVGARQLNVRSISHAILRMVEVNTIDGFQGREKDIIVMSSVRSRSHLGRGGKGLGFVADERRLNVAITRAKKNCIVVGNMVTLSGIYIPPRLKLSNLNPDSISSSNSISHLEKNVWFMFMKSLMKRNAVFPTGDAIRSQNAHHAFKAFQTYSPSIVKHVLYPCFGISHGSA